MRFLSDENFPGDAVIALRATGHDDSRSEPMYRAITGSEVDPQPTKSCRLQVDHVQAGVNRRFSHPAIEGQDVSRRTRERQREV